MVDTDISGSAIKGPYQEIKYVYYSYLLIKSNKNVNFNFCMN